jgi:hypothetical protein
MFLETRQPALAGRTHTLPQTVANLPRATLGEAAEGGNSDRRCGVVTGCGTGCRQASTLAIFEPAIRATGAPGKRGQTGSNTPRKRFTAPSQNGRGRMTSHQYTDLDCLPQSVQTTCHTST